MNIFGHVFDDLNRIPERSSINLPRAPCSAHARMYVFKYMIGMCVCVCVYVCVRVDAKKQCETVPVTVQFAQRGR